MSTATSRPYHHGNLRSVLLAHAERALSERGAGELSLRELAREAGVSHAAPRRHFADKRALLDALALDGFERLREEIEAAIDSAGKPFKKRLTAFARTYVGFATQHAALLELMFAGKQRAGADKLREASEATFAIPLGVIAEGQETGEVAGGETEKIAMVAFATLQGLASLVNSGIIDGADLDAVVAEAVEQLLRGLRPR
jgi:AcrR family transcriptional regulator